MICHRLTDGAENRFCGIRRMPAKCRYACRSILTGLEARRRIEIDRSSVSAPDRHARDFRRVRIELESELSGATFHAGRSDAVLQEMWEK
jgi:hypothetical protein